MMILVLILGEDDAVEIASDKVADDDAQIYGNDLWSIGFPEIERDAKIIECISHTVGESADYEERDTEHQGHILFLTSKLHCRSHNESAAYAEETAAESTGTESELENVLGSVLDLHRSDTSQKRSTEAAYNISEENQEKGSHLVLLDESRRSGIKSEFISDHSKKSEREEHRSC